MNPWYAKAVLLLAIIALIAIRAPHGQRSRSVAVKRCRKGPLEVVLLTIAWISFFLPLIWMLSPIIAFADYPLHPIPFFIGIVFLIIGLWLFYRSHADL